MPDFTPLERAVMAALVWDLDDVVPDLAGQFGWSLPGVRRNTGSGLFTEMIVDPGFATPPGGATGVFGTVHAMVGDLADPIAFKVRLRDGRLLALEGDAYGQDTTAIGFAVAPFDQVFTLDDEGRSIPFDAWDPAKAELDLQRPDPALPPPPEPSPLMDTLRRVQNAGLGPMDAGEPTAKPSSLTGDQWAILLGVWAVLGVAALFASLIFRVPLIFAVAVAVWIGRFARAPRTLDAIADALARRGLSLPGKS